MVPVRILYLKLHQPAEVAANVARASLSSQTDDEDEVSHLRNVPQEPGHLHFSSAYKDPFGTLAVRPPYRHPSVHPPVRPGGSQHGRQTPAAIGLNLPQRASIPKLSAGPVGAQRVPDSVPALNKVGRAELSHQSPLGDGAAAPLSCSCGRPAETLSHTSLEQRDCWGVQGWRWGLPAPDTHTSMHTHIHTSLNLYLCEDFQRNNLSLTCSQVST